MAKPITVSPSFVRRHQKRHGLSDGAVADAQGRHASIEVGGHVATHKKAVAKPVKVRKPQLSTPRHKPTRERVEPPEGPQVRVGCIGLVRHRWRWDKSSECWLSLCSRIGTSKTPDGKRGKRKCAMCAGSEA